MVCHFSYYTFNYKGTSQSPVHIIILIGSVSAFKGLFRRHTFNLLSFSLCLIAVIAQIREDGAKQSAADQMHERDVMLLSQFLKLVEIVESAPRCRALDLRVFPLLFFCNFRLCLYQIVEFLSGLQYPNLCVTVHQQEL